MAKKSKSEKTIGEKTTSTNRDKIIELTISNMEKIHGAGVIISNKSTLPEVGRISSGSVGLDKALGGGYGRGRIIEIYGPESSGKTTLALHALAETQKAGGVAAFIDAEHALDAGYATNLGVNMDAVLLCQPDCGDQALNVVDQLTRSNAVDLIVIDSVPALVPKAELEGEIGGLQPGLQARLMSQAMRMIVGPASKTNTAIIFINQIRMKIGVMFGNPETTSGGNALKFYTSQRLDIRRTGALGTDDDKFGISTKVKVVKNKLAPPFQVIYLDILFGKGIDWAKDLVDQAALCGVIEKSGAWYKYGEEQFHGAAAMAEKLRTTSDLAGQIYQQVMTT